MLVAIQYTSLGVDSGPTYNLTADVGTVDPATITKGELIAGKIVTVSNSATTITVTSTNLCTNSNVLTITGIPGATTSTTTTTAAPVTTSTTTTTAAPATTTTTTTAAPTTTTTTAAPTTTTTTTAAPTTTTTTTAPSTANLSWTYSRTSSSGTMDIFVNSVNVVAQTSTTSGNIAVSQGDVIRVEITTSGCSGGTADANAYSQGIIVDANCQPNTTSLVTGNYTVQPGDIGTTINLNCFSNCSNGCA